MNIDFRAFIRYAIAAWIGSTLAVFAFNLVAGLILVGPAAMALISLQGVMNAGISTIFFAVMMGLIVAQRPIPLFFALMWGLTWAVMGLAIAILGPVGQLLMWVLFIGLWFFPQYINIGMLFTGAQIGAVAAIVYALTGHMGIADVLISLGTGLAMALGAYHGTKLT